MAINYSDGYISYITRGLSFDDITTIALIDSTLVPDIPQVPGQETPAIHYSTTKDDDSFVFDFTTTSQTIQFNTIAIYTSSGLVCYAMSNFYMFNNSTILVRPEINIEEHVIDLKLSKIDYTEHVEQVFDTVHARIIDRVITKPEFRDLLKFNKDSGYQYFKDYIGYESKRTLDKNKLYYNEYFRHIHRDLFKNTTSLDSVYRFYFNSIVKLINENTLSDISYFEIDDSIVNNNGTLVINTDNRTVVEDENIKFDDRYYINLTKTQYNDALYKANTYINDFSQGIIIPVDSEKVYVLIDYQFNIMQYKIYLVNLKNYMSENIVNMLDYNVDENGIIELDKPIENHTVDISDISEETIYSNSSYFRPRVSRLDNRFLIAIGNKILVDIDIDNSQLIRTIDNYQYELGIDGIYTLGDMSNEIPVVEIETSIPSYSYTPQHDDYQVEIRKAVINSYVYSDNAQYIDLPNTSNGGIILNRATFPNKLSNSLLYNEDSYLTYINTLLNPVITTSTDLTIIADEADFRETLTDNIIKFDNSSSAKYDTFNKRITFPTINDTFEDIMNKLYKTYSSQYINTNNYIYYLDKFNATKVYPFNTLPEFYLFKHFYIDNKYQLLKYKTFYQITDLDEQTLREYQYFKYLGATFTYLDYDEQAYKLTTNSFYKISWDERSTPEKRYYNVEYTTSNETVKYQSTLEYQMRYYNFLLNELLYVKYRKKPYLEFKIFDCGIVILEDMGDNILLSVYNNSLNTSDVKFPIPKTLDFNVDIQNLQLIITYKLNDSWRQFVLKLDNYVDGEKETIVTNGACMVDYSGTNVKVGELLI